MSRLKINALRNTAGTTDSLTLNADGSVSSLGGTLSPFTGFKNRIINGDMRIDQRNAGAAVTPTGTVYTVDRWKVVLTQSSKLTFQQSTNAPAGFINSLSLTSTSAYAIAADDYFVLQYAAEGYDTADFGWGTANARPISLSFKVNASVTGTYSLAIRNYGSYNRSYVTTYTVPVANTWTDVTIAIPGDTAGTWNIASNGSLLLDFSLGIGSSYSTASVNSWQSSSNFAATGAVSLVGNSGATFRITGVQLEKGSVATEFERRDYGRELAMCQRYYEKSQNQNVVPGTSGQLDGFWYALVAGNTGSGNYGGTVNYKVPKRANATFTSWDNAGNINKCNTDGQGSNITLNVVFQGQNSVLTYVAGHNNPGALSFFWTASAEL